METYDPTRPYRVIIPTHLLGESVAQQGFETAEDAEAWGHNLFRETEGALPAGVFVARIERVCPRRCSREPVPA